MVESSLQVRQAETRLEFLEKLGSGSFGQVWIARHYEAGEDQPSKYVAAKVEINPTEDNELEKEFLKMKAIGKHKNIIEYIEFAKDMHSALV